MPTAPPVVTTPPHAGAVPRPVGLVRRVARSTGSLLAWVLLLAFMAWWTLAVLFRGPAPHALVAGLYAAIVLGLLVAARRWGRRLVVLALVLGATLLWWGTIRPSNDREWMADVVRLPSFEIDGDRLVVHGLRNFDYRSETDFTPRWEFYLVQDPRIPSS